LADAVESADALLEDFGIEGEVEEDEVVGELEVTSFTADFGAEEDLGAFGVGEPGGVTVALEEGEVFVEDGAGVGEVLLEGRFQGDDFVQGRTDEEDFLFLEFLDELEEPGEAGVGVGFGGEGEVGISGIDGELDGELFDVVGGGGRGVVIWACRWGKPCMVERVLRRTTRPGPWRSRSWSTMSWRFSVLLDWAFWMSSVRWWDWEGKLFCRAASCLGLGFLACWRFWMMAASGR
jgi:hypothetical protein